MIRLAFLLVKSLRFDTKMAALLRVRRLDVLKSRFVLPFESEREANIVRNVKKVRRESLSFNIGRVK
jgi:hypothetical protein